MSHIVSIQTQVRDPAAVVAACRRLGLAEPVQQTVRLFTSTETGLAVQLPGWRYPVVCDVASGSVKFDNYQGNWGDQKELDRLLQMYAVEKAKIEARRRGHTVIIKSEPFQLREISQVLQASVGDLRITTEVQLFQFR